MRCWRGSFEGGLNRPAACLLLSFGGAAGVGPTRPSATQNRRNGCPSGISAIIPSLAGARPPDSMPGPLRLAICTCHWAPPRARRMWPDARLLYIIWGSLGPVKPCRAIGLFSPKVVNDSADAEGAEHPKYHQRIKNYGYCHGYCTFRSSSCISVNHDDMPDMTFFLTKRIFISFVTS